MHQRLHVILWNYLPKPFYWLAHLNMHFNTLMIFMKQPNQHLLVLHSQHRCSFTFGWFQRKHRLTHQLNNWNFMLMKVNRCYYSMFIQFSQINFHYFICQTKELNATNDGMISMKLILNIIITMPKNNTPNYHVDTYTAGQALLCCMHVFYS